MFYDVPERRMHIVKWVIVIAWITLIASLFYDPITANLTDPFSDWSRWSFLRIPEEDILTPSECRDLLVVQGECIKEQPYAIAAKVFWGMVIPCAVMLLLVLGHETWRRICPLSFLSQIPRALGWQRRQKVVNPRTGAVRHELVKIDKDSWLGRNHLYFQFILLCTGLCVRILFINSDRLFLGLWFTATIVAAITVGYLYAGKSWCQYFCPMAPVQTAYNGPRALLGSEAHQGARQSITQSMCRTVDKTGQEKSACVSCQSPCVDIDAERHYWDSLEHKRGRQFSQYGYVGLVTGFYLYFWLYSGTLNYYYSGTWNHDEEQLNQLFNPGYYIFGQPIPIPKLIAAPLTIFAFVGGGYLLFSWLEKVYRGYRQRINKPISVQQSRHIIFSLATFVVFNIYFMFGGRPILKLVLTDTQQLFFNGFVMLISSLWLYRTLGRSAEAYSRESLAGSLRRQLTKLPIDFSKFLEGRSIESLKPDEVYVLAKVLPGFNQESKLQVYKGLLRDQLEQGYITSVDSLEALKAMRLELGVKEEDHFTVLNELGVETPDLLDPNKQRSPENQLRIDSYKQALELQLWDLLEMGISLPEALQRRQKQIQALEEEYGITPEEKAQLLDQMTSESTTLLRKADALLSQLKELAVQDQVLSNLVACLKTPVYMLLHTVAIEQKQRIVTKQLLGILEILGKTPEAHTIASTLGLLAENVLPQIFIESFGTASWQKRLSPEVMALLQSNELDSLQSLSSADMVMPLAPTNGNAIPRSLSADRQAQAIEVLKQLLQELEPLIQAAALYGLEQLDPQQGCEQARQLLCSTSPEYWLVRETAESIILGQGAGPAMTPALITDITMVAGRTERRIFHQGIVQIGRSRMNDIVLDAPNVAQEHAILYLEDGGASVIDLRRSRCSAYWDSSD